MNRRIFLEFVLAILTLAGISSLAGCQKKEIPPRLGNQEKLWQMASASGKTEEPLVPSYAKDTPAFFRDASLGKVDPNFQPKIGGG